MPERYYTYRLLGERDPVTVLRFFDEPGKPPEVLKRGAGWGQNSKLWARIASGEIDDSDIISREEAQKIIESWAGAL